MVLLVVSYLLEGKTVYQSSTDEDWEGYPVKAVDGNYDGHLVNGMSCSLTSVEVTPWWMADLGANYFLKGVVLKNRDDCCGRIQILILLMVILDQRLHHRNYKSRLHF